MPSTKTIDLTLSNANDEISNTIRQISGKQQAVRLLLGKKVVAEIVPAGTSAYVASNNLYPADEEPTDYQTMGENLSGVS
jgi:hypothetical protein